ncbi:MAG TPA: RNB domain-containing ribonuclease [Povalibacter sp.]|nr:RNB domain-containing ribonuclease [Povalibacter sp.]
MSQPFNMHDLRQIARRVMVERGFQPDFPAAALQQANAVGDTTGGAAIRDLRSLPWLSIDNDDSLDLDQLSVAQPLANAVNRVLVAIADVDVAVRRDSPIDAHARGNTTSVYTAAQIFPMLPEKLSTDLTSLADHQERCAMVVEMTVNTDGSIAAADVYRALVFNHAKLAYGSVSDWLEGRAAAPAPIADSQELQQQIRIQDVVAQCMRKVRQTHGAMSLETIEAEAVFSDGALRDFRAAKKGRAKELIEDLMVAANSVTARFLEDRGFPSLRRILKTPKRWDRIMALAASHGEQLPPTPDAAALSAFLTRRRQADPAQFAEVSLAVVKMLGSGEYGVDVPGRRVEGHFGLAVSDYTHSTAPNRRFPDLVTQRLLKAAVAGGPSPYTEDELQAIAQHCTEQEDNAAKVERQIRKSAAALLLQSRIGQHFDGIVTGASDKGTWVRISGPVAEGKIVRGAHGLDVGDRVHVQLTDVNVERGFIDFVRAQ